MIGYLAKEFQKLIRIFAIITIFLPVIVIGILFNGDSGVGFDGLSVWSVLLGLVAGYLLTIFIFGYVSVQIEILNTLRELNSNKKGKD